MKKLFAAMLTLTALTALTGPVAAQLSTGRERQKTMLQMEDEQKKKAADKAQKEYDATMRKTQGGDQTVVDPWANMRTVEGAQPKR
jgi:hypothetical protein